MANYIYLGYGVTDSNGEAKLDHNASGNPISHSYTGTGAGEIDIVASLDNPIGEGSIQSETYSIYDTLFADRGSDSEHNTHYLNYQSLFDVEYTSDYTILKKNSSTAGRYSIVNDNNNYLRIPFDTRFECDIKVIDASSSNTPFRLMNADATSNLSYLTCVDLGLSIGEWGTAIFDVKNDGLYVNGEKARNLPSGTTSAVALAFWSQGDITEIHFKNLKIYPV